MARSTLARVMPEILAHEGGYIDHPSDPGGATKHGITIRTLSEWRGRPVTKAEVRALTSEEAARILEERYWKPIKGDALPRGVDYALFDFAINSGPSRAAMYLQRIVGVAADGVVGPATLRAISRGDAAGLVNALCDARLAFLKGLKGWPTFGRGWTARLARVRATSLTLAGTAGEPLPETSVPTVPPRAPSGGREAYGRLITAILALVALAIAAWFKFGG